MSDVNPDHYSMHAIQPIEYILENKLGFCAGAVVKYVTRAGFKLYPGKDQDQSEIADLEKVIRFAEMRINYLSGEEIVPATADDAMRNREDPRLKFTYYQPTED